MSDEIERQLEQLGQSPVPPVDGAFSNRLETTLREQFAEPQPQKRALSWLRPGVLVLGAVAALVAGALLFADSDPDLGFADGGTTTTTPTETTSVAPTTQPNTTAPDTTVPSTNDVPTTAPVVADQTTAVPTTAPETTAPQTTIPPTTSPETTIPETTIPATTIPESAVELTIRRSDRAIVASWTTDRDLEGLAGWVLIRTLDGDGDRVATSREPATRQFRATVTDLDQTFRVEGLTADGRVIVASAEVPVP